MGINFGVGCVYLFKSIEGELLYIGKTFDLRSRFRQHLSDPEEWKNDIHYIEYMVIENEVDRDIIETYCINLYKPIYNKDKVFGNTVPTIDIQLPKKEIVLKTDILSTINKRKVIGNFKECCIEYIDNPESRDAISEVYPLIREAYEKLGDKKIKNLHFVKKSIKSAIYNSCEEVYTTLVNNLKTQLIPGNFYSAEQLKNILDNEFKLLNINTLSKGSLIKKYLNVKKTTKRVYGKVTCGYLIEK